jgi:hypothetical protein
MVDYVSAAGGPSAFNGGKGAQQGFLDQQESHRKRVRFLETPAASRTVNVTGVTTADGENLIHQDEKLRA